MNFSKTKLIPEQKVRGGKIRRKVIVLGDAACGKSWLLSTYSHGHPPKTDISTAVDIYVSHISIDRSDLELSVWDSSGLEEYEDMRRQTYHDAHLVLVCFSIANPASYRNVFFVWSLEAKSRLRNVPIILVGCKMDLRHEPKTLEDLAKRERSPVSPEQVRTLKASCTQFIGFNMMKDMGAIAYFETSALSHQGLPELFEYAALAAIHKGSPSEEVFIPKSPVRQSLKKWKKPVSLSRLMSRSVS
ncbi:P-loop containing nucleoside triphosphate hydrolase protein [Zopfia rhizophila CBS 207.26]|uniref:P-loop containing nucleoside triphosphate hydrolase protein n=1 Tax=Zopfia rhizophila CBS 207.26 TaxID=1314779 RepID=A0A6A6EQY1_9PEZI|nr:P-loop containing nucleoside triphosphate hydrolase protein [Zopfia rhizophila CBS 207.26]